MLIIIFPYDVLNIYCIRCIYLFIIVLNVDILIDYY